MHFYYSIHVRRSVAYLYYSLEDARESKANGRTFEKYILPFPSSPLNNERKATASRRSDAKRRPPLRTLPLVLSLRLLTFSRSKSNPSNSDAATLLPQRRRDGD